MGKSYRQPKSPWVLLFLLFLGGVAGNVVAHFLPSNLGTLKAISSLGIKPVTLDIVFLQFTFGLTMNIGILTVIGFLGGYFLYRKI